MCLDMRVSRTDKRIKNPIVGKKYIICYNKAYKRKNGNYYPIWAKSSTPYEKGWNETEASFSEYFSDSYRKYMPHFHRFRSLGDARKYGWGGVILKWLVPVDSITTVGLQSRRVVVITKRCKLLGETK